MQVYSTYENVLLFLALSQSSAPLTRFMRRTSFDEINDIACATGIRLRHSTLKRPDYRYTELSELRRTRTGVNDFFNGIQCQIQLTSIASNIVLQAANSLINFLAAWRSFFSNFNFSLASFSNAFVWLSSSSVAAAVVVTDCGCGGGGGGVDGGLCPASVCDVCGGLDDCAETSSCSWGAGISSSTLSVDVVILVVVVVVVVVVVLAEMICAFCAGVVDGFESTEVGCSSNDVDATEWVGL